MVVQLSSSGGATPNKEDLQEFSAAYYLLVTLTRVHPRSSQINQLINQFIPCFRILPNIINSVPS